MLADIRCALRTLGRNRSFTAVTVLTLALGIGSAAAIFSVADWALFRANKFPDDVFLIGEQSDQGQFMPVCFDFTAHAYIEQTNVISAYAKAAHLPGNIVVEGQPVGSSWLGVSINLFPMLGTKMTLGRGFLPGEDVEGANHVVVITHHFWDTYLGGRADVLGRKITVGDAVCTIVGVTPAAQTLPAYFWSDVYRPLAYRVDPAQPWFPNLFLLGQLRAGVSRAQATAALATAKPDVPAVMRGIGVTNRPALSSMSELRQSFRLEIYWVLLGAVGFLYGIACLNASNLMLLRMLGQRRDLCVRLALGCGRRRLIRLLAVESVTLGLLAALTGLLVANWLFPLLLGAAGGSAFAPDWAVWNLSGRVVGVLGGLAVITSAAIVAIPALRVLRTDIHAGLKDGGPALGESPALARLRGGLVMLQAAFAVILLAGAGLMIQTFRHLREVDLGFDPAGHAKVQINFPADYPKGTDERLARLHEIQERLRRIPGVRDAAYGSDLLLPGYYYASNELAGADGRTIKAAMGMFGLDYPKVAGLTLKRGRWLNQAAGNEVMVNEALARARWPGADPVGQWLRPPSGKGNASAEWKGWQVVGVVGDVRATLREAPGNYVYGPERWGAQSMNTFIVRLTHDYNEAFAGTIRRDLYAFDPRIVVAQTLPLTGLRDNQLWAERLADSALKVLAGIALVLTVVGIFSVLAYTVDRRMGEFGVRLALGATRRDLMELVIRRGVRLTIAGVALGLGGAFALGRYVQTLLFETKAQDPWVLGAVGTIMVVTSVFACALPARRAAQADVTKLLRSE